jgi:tetratricopeptide (TPR) repeat protein
MLLSAVEVAGRWGWRWLLTDPDSGTALADHTVRLDSAGADTAAFSDVYRWLRWNADPERRLASESGLVAGVGRFVRDSALGASVVDAITGRAPATVRVVVPVGAEWLAFLPWELAHDDGGRPLAGRGDVTFVYDLRAQSQAVKAPVASAVRVLAVFSLPTSQSLLGLRRERYELTQLVQRIRARTGGRIELTVAQYGATRERLAELASDGVGWDVLHLSGHGGAGQFLLEKPDGTPDPVTTEDLLALLDRARRRVKLVVVSACESAAATTAETLRWLGLTEQAEPLEAQAEQEAEQAAAAQSGLARAVAERFGCAVVAMRYPVIDDFAIALAGGFYDRLWARRQPVDRAFTEAVTQAVGPIPTPGAPALSVGTPALFGASAIGLALAPPPGPVSLKIDEAGMSGFLPEPARFVGRGPALADASRVLAPEWSGPGSGPVAVVFHGMAGAGKTACALEVAYRHRDSFTAHAFWAAPTDPDQFGDALRLLAVALEQQLPDFTMVDKIGNPQEYQGFLPRLKTVLRDNGILLVLDNLETLLTEDGSWRDPRWEPLIATVTGHSGQTRTILTSRIVPTGLDLEPGRVRVLPVHALTRDETLLLARELPHLRALLESTTGAGPPGPLRAEDTDTEAGTGSDPDAGQQTDGQPVLVGRELALATLELVQGHPKMLELADAAAGTDPTALAAAVTAARSALPGARLQAFLTTGVTALDGEQLFTALTAWTTTAADILPETSRLLLQILCQAEELDRDSPTLEGNWADIWHRLQQPGEPPPHAEALTPLLRSALVAAQPLDPTIPNPDQGPVRYRIHPGIAQTIQATTPSEVADAVDTELAAWFTTLARHASDQADAGRDTTRTVVYAGIHAAPYLLRLHDWDAASTVLERARGADPHNPITLQAVIPPLEQIAAATGAADDIGVLAAALRKVDPARAETLLQQIYTHAVQNSDHRVASPAAAALINLYQNTGRAREALTLVEQKIPHTRAAGLGPWTQLQDQSRRLQILAALGQHQDVLNQLPPLLKTMEQLPDQPGAVETVRPWNVGETLYDTGHTSAMALGRWQEALDYNAKTLSSTQRRGATPLDLARTRFNDAGPLIELGRYDEAEQILGHVQQAFEHAGDTPSLGIVFAARANIESWRGHHADAVRLQRQALRLDYIRPDPTNIAASHHNLANYLAGSGGDPAEQRAHRLAASLLYTLIGDAHWAQILLRALAGQLRNHATTDDITDVAAPTMPTTVAEVAALVQATEGVHYTNLITALTDRDTADHTLTQLIRTAAIPDPDQQPASDIEEHLAKWQSLIQAFTTAAATGGPIPDELTEILDQLAASQNWNQLATAIRRVLAGDRDPNTLLTGLDAADTAILTAILDQLPT